VSRDQLDAADDAENAAADRLAAENAAAQELNRESLRSLDAPRNQRRLTEIEEEEDAS
jgi:hypothetical protein